MKALSRFKISCISNLTVVRLELIEKRDVEKGGDISNGCSTWGGVRHVGVGTYGQIVGSSKPTHHHHPLRSKSLTSRTNYYAAVREKIPTFVGRSPPVIMVPGGTWHLARRIIIVLPPGLVAFVLLGRVPSPTAVSGAGGATYHFFDGVRAPR